jgi:hypothetical protein
MTESDTYSLKLNLPGRLVPWVHLVCGAFCTFWLLSKVYGISNSLSTSLTLLTAFLIGWASIVGPLVTKILAGPISIEVKNDKELTFTNTFGLRTDLSFDDILSVSTRWYVLSIRTTSGNYITTNGFSNFHRFLADISRHTLLRQVSNSSAT